MKDSIIVKTADLYAEIKQMYEEGFDYTNLTIMDEDNFEDEPLPACITLSGLKESDPLMWVDFNEVEVVPNESELNEG